MQVERSLLADAIGSGELVLNFDESRRIKATRGQHVSLLFDSAKSAGKGQEKCGQPSGADDRVRGAANRCPDDKHLNKLSGEGA